MIKIDITGLKEGEYDVSVISALNSEECSFEEFFGNISLIGKIRKAGNRYSLSAKAQVNAKLICDRSLKEYEEVITADVNLGFVSDTKAYLETKPVKDSGDSDIIIREDAHFINVTNEVTELLALELPMKRIAPEYRDKELEEIYPELKEKSLDNSNDDRWSKLKDLKIN